MIEKELQQNPKGAISIPDHRIRRLQHLLSDLVELLDQVSAMKFKRPIRRCEMMRRVSMPEGDKALACEAETRAPCDCSSLECNPQQRNFEHRQLAGSDSRTGLKANNSNQGRSEPPWQNARRPRGGRIQENLGNPC